MNVDMLVSGLSMKVNERPLKINLCTWYSGFVFELEVPTVSNHIRKYLTEYA